MSSPYEVGITFDRIFLLEYGFINVLITDPASYMLAKAHNVVNLYSNRIVICH